MRTVSSLQNPRSAVRFVAQVAVFTALSVLVRRVLTPQVIFLNLGGLPLIMSGLLLGPVAGAYVGGLSDIIGGYLMPHGSFNILFTCTAMLTATLPVLTLRLLRCEANPGFWALLMAITVGQCTTKVILIPLILHSIAHVPLFLTALKQCSEQLVHAPLYAVLAGAVLRATRRSVEVVRPLERRLAA